MDPLFLNIQVDCEATQHSINDPALGERALAGLAEILGSTGTKATFVVIPSDIRVHHSIYRDLAGQGHEVGLHVHPADLGCEEFLGVYGLDEQVKIIGSAADVFAEAMGVRPAAFTPGYFSANDHTFPALEAVGLRHGTVSCPTRNLPRCACVWGDCPLDIHYPHRFNRCLAGEVDFVEIPMTIDPTSRLWGGAHPQDLRVELVDVKNHWYTIDKTVARQTAANPALPVKYVKILTHNVFNYNDSSDFRRETLLGMIRAVREIATRARLEVVPATAGEIAAQYRRLVPRPTGGEKLRLDTRGRQKAVARGEPDYKK